MAALAHHRCCYKLRDVGRLGVSTERLAAARRMLARAHGADQERLRRLHGGFSPEQAMCAWRAHCCCCCCCGVIVQRYKSFIVQVQVLGLRVGE